MLYILKINSMKNLIFVINILLLLSSCSRNDDENKSYPECLSNIISTVQQIPVQKPKVEVKKYKY